MFSTYLLFPKEHRWKQIGLTFLFQPTRTYFVPFHDYTEIGFNCRALKLTTTFQKHKHLINWETGEIWRGGRARNFPLPVCMPYVGPGFLARAELEGIMDQTFHGAGGETEGCLGGSGPACYLIWWLSLPSHSLSRRWVSESEGSPRPGQALPVKARHDVQNRTRKIVEEVLPLIPEWGLVGLAVTKRLKTYFPGLVSLH